MKIDKKINLNTILLLIVLAVLFVLAYYVLKPNGILQMLETIYYTSNIFG